MYEDHPHPLLKFDLPNDTKIRRYMDLARFVSLLDKGLAFVKPELLVENDPREGFFSRIMNRSSWTFSKLTESSRNSVFLNCWYVGDEDSPGMWKRYAKNKGDVSIHSTIGRLKTALGTSKQTFHLFRVAYVSRCGSRAGEHDKEVPMLLAYKYKGKKFAFEQEIRAITWDPALDPRKIGPVIYAPCDDIGKLITDVHLSPNSGDWHVEVVNSLLGHYGVLDVPVTR
jgi:hypothetical protein